MNLIENTLAGEWIYALGWTVLHSLWQAAVIALIVGVVLWKMQKRAAWQRYWVANIGWLSILVCAVITFISYYQLQGISQAEQITRLDVEGEAALFSSPSLLGSYLQVLSDYFNRHLPLIVSLWALGMSVFLLRFLGGLIYIQHLRSYKVQKLPVFWEDKLSELGKKLGLKRPVQLLESALVKVPLAIGWLKPLILMPIGALNSLNPQQVEAILAHELAHIKRHDYLLNMLRSLVEVLFYFNPAVWWLSAQIRMEREHCCDDIALEVCGNSLSYVRALVALQELSQQPAAGLAMSFAGSKPELLMRVRRILNQPKDKSDIMEKFVTTCLLLVGLSFMLLSAGLPNRDTTAAKDPALTNRVEAHNRFAQKIKSRQQPEHAYPAALQVAQENRDTLPSGITRMRMTKDGKAYDVKIKNNKIQQLLIDGKSIPEKELGNYYDLVQTLLDEIPEPPAPPTPPTPVAMPAPVASPSPPSPPSPKSQPVPSPIPTSPMPPMPPTPGAVAPAPPPPPAAPRIKLQKPVKEENDLAYTYNFKIADTQKRTMPNSLNVVWDSADGTAPASIWVSNEDEQVVVVEVKADHVLHTRTEDPEIVLELKMEVSDQDADESVVSTRTAQVQVVESRKSAYFYGDEAQLERVVAPGNWRQQLEAKMVADDLLESGGTYQVELAADQLRINGKAQPAEVYSQYVQLLEKSLGKPLEKNAYYFFNHHTRKAE